MMSCRLSGDSAILESGGLKVNAIGTLGMAQVNDFCNDFRKR